MVSIIDYGAGNLMSVKKALDYLGVENEITDDKDRIHNASHVILPGVGSFEDAMNSMKERELVDVIKETATSGKPFLGICLGLQLLFSHSDESPNAKGLGILEGEIKSIPKDLGLKVPHMGWNSIDINPNSRLFKDIPNESYFYFVHSYYLTNAVESEVSATTHYGVNIECAVEKSNLFATQFHPEKSGSIGLKVLSNFVGMEG